MGTKDHFVSQFHLRQFLDPDALGQKDPWLWHGSISNGLTKRRAPKNLGFKSSMFDGPGCFSDPGVTLEKHLAEKVEGPAASALQTIANQPNVDDLPPELMRYLAWAAARSLPMKVLMESWADLEGLSDRELVEPPADGLLTPPDRKRSVAMKHSGFGKQMFESTANLEELANNGWVVDFDDSDTFLQAVHLQAWYFQARWFPLFRWYSLRAPQGQFFVIADRAVAWAADGYIDAPPSCLRDPSAYVLAPISKDIVLVGRHGQGNWNVSPGWINEIIACWAHDWIAGPEKQTVEDALSARRFTLR